MDFKKSFYDLDSEGNPIPGDWWDACFLLEDIDRRRVGEARFFGVRVSTVFLVLDHGFSTFFDELEDAAPVLFETMVFGGEFDGQQWRYKTRQEAVQGHRQVVRMIVGRQLLGLVWNKLVVTFGVAGLVVWMALMSGSLTGP